MSTTQDEEPANEVDLDKALAPPPSPSAFVTDAALADLVAQARAAASTEPADGSQRRSQRRRWAIPLVVGGVLALTAAGSITAYQLGVPPFQSVDAGTQRTSAGIPVDYLNYRHRSVHCLAFVEFADVSAAQRRQINAFAADTDWSGYGQRLVDTVPAADRTTLAQDVHALKALGPDLTRRTMVAVPGLKDTTTPGVPRVTGTSWSCTGKGGQDGAS